MGLLTINTAYQSVLVNLRIPNYFIETIYWEYIAWLTQDSYPDVRIEHTKIGKAIVKITFQGNPQP